MKPALENFLWERILDELQLHAPTLLKLLKSNTHNAIWSHTIYISQHVHYKIVRSYVAYNMSYRIKLLSIPYNATKSYATKSQRVYWA